MDIEPAWTGGGAVMRVLLAALLAACARDIDVDAPEIGASEPVTLALTSDELAAIPRAADAWNAVTREDKRIVCEGRSCLIGDRWWSIVKEEPCCPPSTGSADYASRTVHVIDGLDADAFELVLTHELGHALGIRGHTRSGVMSYDIESEEINVEVLGACRAVEACP